MLFIYLLAAVFQFSCKPDSLADDIALPDYNYDFTLHILWKSPIQFDTTLAAPYKPVFYNGGVLSGSEKLFTNYNAQIKMFDGGDGALKWVWDYKSDELVQFTISTCTEYQLNNIYIKSGGKNITAIDLNTGNTLWSTDNNFSLVYLSGYYDRIYYCATSGISDWQKCYLMSASVYDGIWDTVFVFDKLEQDGYCPSVPTVTTRIDGNNDTLLYFQNRAWNFEKSDGRIDVYCYNQSKDSIIWSQMDIEEFGQSSIKPPIIYDDKLYFLGEWWLYCFDEYTGELIWKHEFGETGYEHLFYGSIITNTGNIIVKTGGQFMYCFDRENGEVLWTNSDGGSSPSPLIYYKGDIYFTGGGDAKFHVVNATTGATVIESYSPYFNSYLAPDSGFKFPLCIDPETDRLYLSDGYFMYCIEIDW